MTRILTATSVVVALLLTACRDAAPPANPTHALTLGPTPTKIERLVTLAPSLTDVVIALGATERLVGVTRFDDATAVADLPRVGGYSDPSAEAILRLDPDLVLCQPSPGNRGAVELIAREGIGVRVLPLQSLADIENAYRSIGALLGLDAKANELIRDLHAARERAAKATSSRSRRPRVVLLYGMDPLVAAGPGSYGDDLLTAAGAENLVAGSTQSWPRLSVEWLAARKPDVVLLAGFGAHGVASANLPAGLDLPTVALESPGMLRPGPRVGEALEELSRVLDGITEDSPP